MRTRYIAMLLVASLTGGIGCSKGNGGQPAPSPPTAPAGTVKPPPKSTEPEIEPEVEPAPGEPVRLTLPRDGGAWPWSVGQASQSPESQSLTFRNLPPYALLGFAARPEANRAVVAIRYEPPKKGPAPPKGQPTSSTRVILCDTAGGRALTEWIVPGLYSILDLSPDGRSILSMSSQGGRTHLRLWVIGLDGQLKRWNWAPHSPLRDGMLADPGIADSGTDIRWAAFAGIDRVVSASRAGQLRVFDTDGLKPLATIDASPSRPGLSPDGSKVAFLLGTSVALLDTRALKLVGTRWVGPAPPHPVLAFSPDGARLAIGGNRRLVLLTLASGDLQSIPMPRLDVNDNGVYDKSFGWAGASQLLVEGNLFDPQLPQPVWDYGGIRHIQHHGWQVWAAAADAGGSTVTIRAFTLPTNEAVAALTAAKARAGTFAIQKGSPIKIDVSAVPEDKRSEALEMLEKRVREIGYVVDPAAPATLLTSVDSPGTKPTVAFVGLGFYQYVRKPVRLQVMLNGSQLWNEAWSIEPPFHVYLPRGGSLSNYLSKLGTGLPDYSALATAPLPASLPGPEAPAGMLGATDLVPRPVPPR